MRFRTHSKTHLRIWFLSAVLFVTFPLLKIFDHYGRLAYLPGKTSLSCPAQDGRTAVILALGQSNIANEVEPAESPQRHQNVFNFFEGDCTLAESPLLGATGFGGEWLSELGDRLIQSGRYNRVIIAPASVGGQLIARFTNGDLSEMIARTVSSLTSRYHVTQVIWHQGESDAIASTDPQIYRAMFLQIVAQLRRHGVDAPIFVSTTTFCPSGGQSKDDNPIHRIQKILPDPDIGVFAGVDTDAFDPNVSRFDGCHLSRQAQSWAADAEARAFLGLDARKK